TPTRIHRRWIRPSSGGPQPAPSLLMAWPPSTCSVAFSSGVWISQVCNLRSRNRSDGLDTWGDLGFREGVSYCTYGVVPQSAIGRNQRTVTLVQTASVDVSIGSYA